MHRVQGKGINKNSMKHFASAISSSTSTTQQSKQQDDWKKLLPKGVTGYPHLVYLLSQEDLDRCEKILKESYIKYLYMIRDTALNMQKTNKSQVFESYISNGYFKHLLDKDNEAAKTRRRLNELETSFNKIIDTLETILDSMISRMSVYQKKYKAIADVTYMREGSFASMVSEEDKRRARRGLRFKHKHDKAQNEEVFEYPVNIDHKIINPFLFIWLDGDVTKFEALHKYTTYQDTGSYKAAGGTSNMFVSVLAHEFTHVANLHIYSPRYVEKILTDDTYFPEEIIKNKANQKDKAEIPLKDRIAAIEFLKERTMKTSIFKRYGRSDEYVRSIAEIEAGLSMLWFGMFYGIIQVWSYFQLQSFILKKNYEYITNLIKRYLSSELSGQDKNNVIFDPNKFIQEFMIHNYKTITEYSYIKKVLLELLENSESDSSGSIQLREGLIAIQNKINSSPNHYGLDFGWYSMTKGLLENINDFIILIITEYLSYLGRNIAKQIADTLNKTEYKQKLTSCLDVEDANETDIKLGEDKNEQSQYSHEKLINQIINTAMLSTLQEMLYRVLKDVNYYVNYVKHYFGKLILNTSMMLITLLSISKIVNVAYMLSKYSQLSQGSYDSAKENAKGKILRELIHDMADVSRYAHLYYDKAKVKVRIASVEKEKEYNIISKDNFIANITEYFIMIADYFRETNHEKLDIKLLINELKTAIGAGLNFNSARTIGDLQDAAFIYGHELINYHIGTGDDEKGNAVSAQPAHIDFRTSLRWGLVPSVALITSASCYNDLRDLLLEFRIDDFSGVNQPKIITVPDNIKQEKLRESIHIEKPQRITINAFDEFTKYLTKTSDENHPYLIRWLGTKTVTMAAMQSAAVKAIFELFSIFQNQIVNFRKQIKNNINDYNLDLQEFTNSLISNLNKFVREDWSVAITALNNADNNNAIAVPQNIHFRKKIHQLLGYSKGNPTHPNVTLLYESLIGPCSVSDFGILTSELHYDYMICHGVNGHLVYKSAAPKSEQESN